MKELSANQQHELMRFVFWLAFAWNDHNFSKHPQEYAQGIANKFGIKNIDDANEWVDNSNTLAERIAELEQECELLVHENADKDMRIAELERERDECAIVITSMARQSIKDGNKPLVDLCGTASRALEKRDLEQQIKGIEDALKFEKDQCNTMALGSVSAMALMNYIQQLQYKLKGYT